MSYQDKVISPQKKTSCAHRIWTSLALLNLEELKPLLQDNPDVLKILKSHYEAQEAATKGKFLLYPSSNVVFVSNMATFICTICILLLHPFTVVFMQDEVDSQFQVDFFFLSGQKSVLNACKLQ